MSMKQWGGAVLALAMTATLVPVGRAADPDEAAAPEFAAIPADAAVVVSLRFGNLWNNEALRPARDRYLKDYPDGAKAVQEFKEKSGVEVSDIDRLTVVLGPGENKFMLFLVAAKPYDRKKAAEVVKANEETKEEKVNGRTLYVNGDSALYFLDDNTLVNGSTENVRASAKRNGPAAQGVLTPALRAGAEKHLLLVAWDAAAASATTEPPFPEFAPLMKAQLAVLTVDLNGQDAKGELHLTFATETEARDGKKGVLDTRDKVLELVRWLNEHVSTPEGDKLKASLTEIETSLKALDVGQDGAAVQARLKMKIDPAATAEAILKLYEPEKKDKP